jgi:hypothetical protein
LHRSYQRETNPAPCLAARNTTHGQHNACGKGGTTGSARGTRISRKWAGGRETNLEARVAGEGVSPVILALYDARADLAYWLYVRRYFAALPDFDLRRAGERVSVTIPCSNVLDRPAMQQLAREKNVLLAEAGRVVFHVAQ